MLYLMIALDVLVVKIFQVVAKLFLWYPKWLPGCEEIQHPREEDVALSL